MIISSLKNSSPLHRHVFDILEHGITAVLPEQLFKAHIRFKDETLFFGDASLPLHGKRLFLVGIGKAAGRMASSIEDIIPPNRISGGLVVTNDEIHVPVSVDVHISDHPIPTKRSHAAGMALISLKRKFNIGKDDVIISLISGGGSSLAIMPEEGISFEVKKNAVELLLALGADTNELTTVKKKISQIKGGKLAAHFAPATIVSIILSDVIGYSPDIVASGPFSPDATSNDDALQVLQKYDLEKSLPEIYDLLRKNNNRIESLDHVQRFCIGSNEDAVKAAAKRAREIGYEPIINTAIMGEANVIAEKKMSELIKRNTPFLFIGGGETTVTLGKKYGRGGRNQEFIASCLKVLGEVRTSGEWIAVAIGTDGVDFEAGVAGAIIDSSTVETSRDQKLDVSDFINRHDTWSLHNGLGTHLSIDETTGTNVCDLIVIAHKPS